MKSFLKADKIYILFLILFICIFGILITRNPNLSNPYSIIEPMTDDENPSKTDYTKQIKSVHSMGVTSKGTWSALNNNVKGLENSLKYCELN